jgi:hypothetical protein
MTKKDATKYLDEFDDLTASDILDILYSSHYLISECYVGKSVTRKNQSKRAAVNQYIKLIRKLIAKQQCGYRRMCRNKAHKELAIRCIMEAF